MSLPVQTTKAKVLQLFGVLGGVLVFVGWVAAFAYCYQPL